MSSYVVQAFRLAVAVVAQTFRFAVVVISHSLRLSPLSAVVAELAAAQNSMDRRKAQMRCR